MMKQSAGTEFGSRITAAGFVAIAGCALFISGCPGGGVGSPGSNATCLGCHNGRTATDMRFFLLGSHKSVNCVVCHVGAEAHVQSGGLGGALVNPASGVFELSYAACATCHQDTVAEFVESGHHESRAVSCHDCHDVHTPIETIGPVTNNLLCRSCHVFDGFQTVAQTEAHTMHPVDPAGTGASRCTHCHMPPTVRTNQANGPHSHTFKTIPPIASNEAADNGISPVPPNSCAGIMGCHDGTVPATPIFNVDNYPQMIGLQSVYDMWFAAP